MPQKARYIMIGGFLGAGKSTSILKLARHLSRQNRKVGIITNDQGEKLVDTAFLNSNGFPVEEIAGGCFCCRFNSLVDAAERLNEDSRPDVFIAEPVGSCTDLVATVSYPLRRIYGDAFSIAPLSVVVDPIRAMRIFSLEEGRNFSDKVIYVYRKQLEEAAIIVINKSDLLSEDRLRLLQNTLAKAYPKASILTCSARNETGLDAWFQRILSAEMETTNTININYATYGEGEALLGWLNATVELHSNDAWDGNRQLLDLSRALKDRLDAAGAEIAHLKMTLSPDENLYGDLAVVNSVRNDQAPEISQSLPDELTSGQIIVNLRAEADPATLRSALTDTLTECEARVDGPALKLEHIEHFRPGQPTPIHRDTVGRNGHAEGVPLSQLTTDSSN